MGDFLLALFVIAIIAGSVLWLGADLLKRKVGNPYKAIEMERNATRPTRQPSTSWFMRYMGL